MIYINGEEVKINKFPNNETYFDIKDINVQKCDDVEIKLKYRSDEDLVHLMMIKDYFDEINKRCNLFMPYIPYSRMDRTEGKRVFTLKTICRMINSMNFERVIVHEPHSDVSIALLDRVEVIDITLILAKAVLDEVKANYSDSIYLVFPDAGAEKRYSKDLKWKNKLTAVKERDFETGRIENLKLIGAEDICKGFTAIIVDDLCSKGGTFMLTAKELKEAGANEIYLVVTHCEDNIFNGEILATDLIKKVYTTDSILSKEHEKIKISNNL